MRISREIGDRFGEATALNNLGVVYERQGRPEQAAVCHEQALALFRRSGDRSGEARALGNLGSVVGRASAGALEARFPLAWVAVAAGGVLAVLAFWMAKSPAISALPQKV